MRHDTFLKMVLFSRGKSILSQAADGANPVFRDIFPGSAGSDSAFGIAGFGIIDITAGAFVLHGDASFLIDIGGNRTAPPSDIIITSGTFRVKS